MLPDKIMQSDLLDILFENRNKNYGAYALRKSYNKILIVSIGCTLFVALGFSMLQFFHHSIKEKVLTVNIIPPDINPFKLPPDKPLTHQPSHIQAASHLKQVINSTPIIAPDDKAKLPPTTDVLDKNIIGSIATDGKDNVDIIQPPAETHEGLGINTIQPVKTIVDEKPLVSAEVMPEYPGGVNALIKFMLKNLHQPDGLQQDEKIKVIASFVVSKTGSIENLKIISSGRTDLDKEVLRVINKMPLWKPGMQNGKAVSVYFNLPVTFQTGDE